MKQKWLQNSFIASQIKSIQGKTEFINGVMYGGESISFNPQPPIQGSLLSI